MSLFPPSLRRIALIARRDFLGYVRTLGFWITVLGPVIGIFLGVFGISIANSAEPTRYVSIIDQTGRYEQLIIDDVNAREDRIDAEKLKLASKFFLSAAQYETLETKIDTDGVEAGRDYLTEVSPDMAQRLPPPARSLFIAHAPELRPETINAYLSGEKSARYNGQDVPLSGILEIIDGEDAPVARFYSDRPNFDGLTDYANDILRRDAEDRYFGQTGITRDGYWAARDDAPKVTAINPFKKADDSGGGQTVTTADKIPYLLAAGLSFFLWLTVFSGAYMLLMSMVEEKVNKALEMMLASTRFTEILFGKLLGVAALTVASMLPWIIMGAIGLFAAIKLGDPALGGALADSVTTGMIITFISFFILGYLFYGALFMALGSLAESMQDAQTLVTPVLLMLTMCLFVVSTGINNPDSALITTASFIPVSAPFAILMRLPNDPPMWEIWLSAAILAASTALVIWGASKLFRHGILSGGLKGLKTILSFGRIKSS
ncbi:ABC transporter permease [Robiginitomaculum antarcticum]|uniref:ABC transporter permease n=1 Tax=Robiginitomaculum antarcticum TaxID=437507 RepID=UPI000380FDF0|nr:ABC transporter permease [Robiginitomaculum antarcticum]